MLLDYAGYRAMGGAAAENAFAGLEIRAEKCIARMTHGRLRGEAATRECVKQAAFALIEAMRQADEHGGRAVESLTNDGVSVKYAVEEMQAAYARIMREFLAGETDERGVALLYAGVDA